MRTLEVPGTKDSLHVIRQYVSAVAAVAGLEEQAAYGLRLAVDEIATNTIEHGYQKSDRAGDVVISATLEDDKLTVVLEDTSPPYDPREAPLPDDLDQAPEERRPGGLGVFLARQGVDAYRYEYEDGANRHIFVMNRMT